MEPKDKIMLQYFKGVKCKQGFTTRIWYIPNNVLGEIRWGYINGLMSSMPKFQFGDWQTVSQEKETKICSLILIC